jgi:glycosyltransferase involved in cell wall biosynthesis
MNCAIVIPAFNEARTIHDVAQRSLAQCELVIVVDDGSTDGTAAALAGLPLTLLRNERNSGKAAALWAGFAEGLRRGADAIVTLDGDGQHQPEDVERLIAAALTHPASIVIGARLRRVAAAPRSRRFANRFADFWLSWACGYPIADSQSGQRLYPAALLREVVVRHDERAGFTLESEILIAAAALGCRSVAVAIDTRYPVAARRSHFRPVRDIARIGLMVTRHLVAQRMNPRGLRNSLGTPAMVVEPGGIAEYNAWRRAAPTAPSASPVD